MCTNKRGQSTVEYAVLIAVIIGALIGMQMYMKRGTMGKLRDSTDQIGDQFDPQTETYALTKTLNGSRAETTTSNGEVTQADSAMTQGKSGSDNPVGRDLNGEQLYY